MTNAPAEDPARALAAEYGLLMAALSATWAVGLGRTNILLGVLSATAIALGLVAQGSGFGPDFFLFALILLPIALFIGLATFIRLVHVARETLAYVIGINRIRHFFQEAAPASRPYYVLSAHDDLAGVYRSLGTGMLSAPPRTPLLHALVQSQGVVAVLNGALAATITSILAARSAAIPSVTVSIAVVTFLVVVAVQLRHWQRSLAELVASLPPINPSSADADGPIPSGHPGGAG